MFFRLLTVLIVWLPYMAFSQALPPLGSWETGWGQARVVTQPNGYRGNYEEDNGSFILWRANLVYNGYWVESMAATKCEFAFLGSEYWGRLQINATDLSKNGFQISWGYCQGGDIDKLWYFSARQPAAPVTVPRQSQTVDNLADRLAVEMRRALPPAPGQQALDITPDDIEQMRQELNQMPLSDSDLAVLEQKFFNSGADFDPSNWRTYTEFVRRSIVSEQNRQDAQQLDQNLRDTLQLPDAAIEYLRSRFFISDSLRDREMSANYSDSYQNFVFSRINGNDAEFNRLVGPDSQKIIEQVFNPAVALPTGPTVGPAPAQPDCSYNAVLLRMRRADPVFDLKWTRFGIPNILTMTRSGQHIHQILRAGLLEAIKQCERNRR